MKLLIGLVAGVLFAAPALADTLAVTETDGTTVDVASLTGFTTNGDDMVGMTVTVTFADATTDTALWGATGVNAGGASGTGWSMSMTGDTFMDFWTLSNTGSQGITGFSIDALTGDTVFDLDRMRPSTDGSGSGLDFFSVDVVGLGLDVLADYSNRVAIIPNAPVGDIYRNLDVRFTNAGGLASDYSLDFYADTDTIGNPVPEPATLALLGLGLGGAAIRRRLRRRGA